MSSSGAAGAGVHSSSSRPGKEREDGGGEGGRNGEVEGDVDIDLRGAAEGWVEARSSCPHLTTMPAAGAGAGADGLARVTPSGSPCSRCHLPAENWL
ncbi:hypothetical protein GUJ93_ZPchr0012g20433 [Zizania palustris]|uniref:Uncharacterized protein n=1 Tax=Zizania palustris TaxID=103762 RepID=A0A8J6BQP1_ZIZPA|nr:hypothetical protein GUJ93_ZPchr0012g20433 [Zizania palustris]